MLICGSDPAAIAGTSEPGEQIIQDRIAKLREIGAAYKHIADELKLGRPDVRKIKESSQLIKDRGAEMLFWFPPGSEPPSQAPKSWLDTILGLFSTTDSTALLGEVKSHAKPAIWVRRAQFEQAHHKFESEAERMWQVTQRGLVPEMSLQVRRLGETCKSCHDVYREKLD
jgi:cytochrome c556